jgi:hypothetical protein
MRIVGIAFLVISCIRYFVCKKKSRNQNETLNARFTVATTARVEAITNNNSQVTFTGGESVISYDEALRNSTLIIQPINQSDLNECKLPTYEEFRSEQIERF